uniref:Uncharacterized protein n=1 Tax=Anguilla anguilla TaxID=7936 RepID=A0A0E9TRB2_ANGAN
MACLMFSPKRCESVSGLDSLLEMWKFIRFSPRMM